MYYNKIMEYSIDTPHGRIAYTLARKKMKNIRIHVTGASEVVVSAPLHAPIRQIEKVVRDNEGFIRSKLRDCDEKRALYYPVTYLGGDTFWHLGRQTTLFVSHADETRAHLESGVLTLQIPPDADYRYRKALFILWSTRTATHIFTERLRLLAPAFPDVSAGDIRINVKNMLGRWGSINTRRHTLNLSVHLLRCDHMLIDYVIVHELCHYAHANHSAAFYRTLERHFPNRKAIDKRLSEYGLIDF